MHARFEIMTSRHNEVRDITSRVQEILRGSGVKEGVCSVYVPHATAAVIINENADPNINSDLLDALTKAVPEHGGYLHDRIDGNATAHIKAAIIGPSEIIPVSGGELALGAWQDVMLCEFDGPRRRQVIVTIIPDTHR
ncbi:YjbQ family protein [Candidatus Woesearchaeota archaeon]|nr:YjbQ family protein [Candidatus Woesearchaeota archaeon]